MFLSGEEYISERVVQEVEQREAGESPTQDVLTYLLSRDMSEDEVVSNVAEMLLSGIDTVSLIFIILNLIAWLAHYAMLNNTQQIYPSPDST